MSGSSARNISVFYVGDEVEITVSLGVPPTNQSDIKMREGERWFDGEKLSIEGLAGRNILEIDLGKRKVIEKCLGNREADNILKAGAGDQVCIVVKLTGKMFRKEKSVLYRISAVEPEGFWDRFNVKVRPYIRRNAFFIFVEPKSDEEKARSLMRKGNWYRIKKHDNIMAMQMFTRCIGLSKNCSGCYVGMALIYEQNGEYRKASKSIRNVMSIEKKGTKDYLYYKHWHDRLKQK